MSNKRNVVLYLDKELIYESRQLGFNLSKMLENTLKQLISRLSSNNFKQNGFPCESEALWWAGPDSDRRPLARKWTQQNIDWIDFREWLSHRYAKSHAPSIFSYCKRYNQIIFGNMREIDRISLKSKNHVVKALIVFSKYLGIHQDFKTSLKNYGIKLFSEDAFSSFMRVYNNQNSNLNEWIAQASKVLRPNEQMFLRFMGLTGLRKEEDVTSFNKIIELSKQNRLNEYYNEEKGLLEHFKYKEQFLRKTKNVYISIVTRELVLDITNCEPVSYNGLSKRLVRAKLPCRINEHRDYFGPSTFAGSTSSGKAMNLCREEYARSRCK